MSTITGSRGLAWRSEARISSPPRPGSIRSSTTASKLPASAARSPSIRLGRDADGKALALQTAPQEVDDPWLVLDHEHVAGASRGRLAGIVHRPRIGAAMQGNQHAWHSMSFLIKRLSIPYRSDTHSVGALLPLPLEVERAGPLAGLDRRRVTRA